MESSSEDEFMSLLFGTRTSPALHQFLVSSLGEAALKRIAKAVDSAGRELRVVVSEHLQPAVEIISFRLAELRGLARWRSRFQNVGLDEKLIYGVTEKIGMLVVQVERFSRVAATVLYLVPFFSACFLAMFSILNLCFNLGLLPEIPLPGQVHRTFCVLEVLVDNIDWTHICLLIWH
jgi:anaphase-promoting complex subunit 4